VVGTAVIVLDTSALILWLDDSPSLSNAARQAIRTAEQSVISSISIWEIALKVKHGRLLMRLPLEQLVGMLREVAGFQIIPVDGDMWLDSVLLDWDHRDPADRVIVALARRFDCPLVTSDRVIGSFYAKAIW
jgi:PIN domain nuclease of toxin-antitoxin system